MRRALIGIIILTLGLAILLAASLAGQLQPSQLDSRKAPTTGKKLSTTHIEAPFIKPNLERVFRPVGVAIAGDGSICIADGNTIKIFSRRGKCRRSFHVKSIRDDNALFRGKGSTLLVLSEDGKSAFRYSKAGKLLNCIRLVEAHEKIDSIDININTDKSGNVYFAGAPESEDIILRKFSPEGRLLWQQEAAKVPGEEEWSNYIIAGDAQGRAWFWTEGGDKILVFDTRGGSEMKDGWQRSQNGPRYFHAAAFDARGNRYELWYETAAGYGTDLIKFNKNGKQLWRYNWCAIEGTGLAIGPSGEAYITFGDFKWTAPTCVEMSPSGKSIRTIGLNGTEAGELRDPSGLAIDANGNFYVGDYYNYRIQKFAEEGRFLGKFCGPKYLVDSTDAKPSPGFEDDSINPGAMRIDKQGMIYVTHSAGFEQTLSIILPSGKLWKSGPDVNLGKGLYSAPLYFGNIPMYPAGIDLDSKGNIWSVIVVEPEQSDNPKTRETVYHDKGIRVTKFSRERKKLLSFGGYGKDHGKFGQPKYLGIGMALLAIDRNDNVWVADPANNRVQKFDNQGRYLGQTEGIAEKGTYLANPWGVIADKAGNIYVGDATRILKFDGKGDFIGVAARLADRSPKTDPMDEWPFRALAVDNRNNIYITDATSNSVRKFIPARGVCLPLLRGRIGDRGG